MLTKPPKETAWKSKRVMTKLLICRLPALIALRLGGSMLMSLPWTLPMFGEVEHFDGRSFLAIIGSMAVCGVVGGALFFLGRGAKHDTLFRKEAIAIVGLSWLMATLGCVAVLV